MRRLVCGVDGGSSNTQAVLMDLHGNVIGRSSGPHTNPWLLGYEECAYRIRMLIDDVKLVANVAQDYSLPVVGLCLSGIDTAENKTDLKNALKMVCPSLVNDWYIANDSLGAIASAFDAGGVVAIAGTGSIINYAYSDFVTCIRVGGNGHMLGDEASGYWISTKAVKILMNHYDGYKVSQFSVEALQKCAFNYFNISSTEEMLQIFYLKYKKSHIAGLCEKLAEVAAQGDVLCCRIFKMAGYKLGRHVAAAVRRVCNGKTDVMAGDTLIANGILRVLCAGNVWKSWKLLIDGFRLAIVEQCDLGVNVEHLVLMESKEAAIGAARLAAKFILNAELPYDLSKNYTVFYDAPVA